MQTRHWLALCAPAVSLLAQSAPAADALDEVSLTRRVCQGGPAEAVARAERARGEAEVRAASVLPNPTVIAEHQQRLTGPTEQETILGISVPLGIGGRRLLLQDAAEARRRKALSDARATQFENALAFREAYVTAATDQALLDVLVQQQVALDGLGTTVEKLTKGGEAAAYDLARQQMQARLHRRLVESAKAQAQASLVLLEAWTGEAVELPPVQLDELAGGVAVRAAPRDASGIRHARLQSLEADAVASSLDARAARRRWVPDVQLFAGYRTTAVDSDRGHGLAISIAVPLTFFDHGQGEAALADADEELARSRAEVLRRQYEAAQRAAIAELSVLEASVADFEQTATDALSLEAKAARLYAAGEVAITELIDTFRTAEEARLGRIELARRMAAARLSLMRAAGTLFDASLDQQCAPPKASNR